MCFFTHIVKHNQLTIAKISNADQLQHLKLDLRGASRPLSINVKRKKSLTQAEKTPELMPHPYIGVA